MAWAAASAEGAGSDPHARERGGRRRRPPVRAGDRIRRFQARLRALSPRPDHRQRRGADVLLAAVVVPGAAVRHRPAGRLRPAGADQRRGVLPARRGRAPGDGRCRHGGVAVRPGAAGHRGRRADHRPRARSQRRLGRLRRRRAGAEHDLPGRRRARIRAQEAQRPGVDPRGDGARAGHVRADLPRRRARFRRVRQDRARRHGRHDLVVRALAGGAARGDDDLRDRLLRVAERGGAPLPLDHARRRGGRPAVDRRVRPVLPLRVELLVVLRHLRRVRGRGDPARVAVGHEPRAAVRGGAQRGGGPAAGEVPAGGL